MRNVVSVRYSGAEISSRNAMRAYEISEAIEGLSDFLHTIAEELFGKDVQLDVSIRPPRHGSFELEYLAEIIGMANTLVSGVGPGNLSEFISQVFNLLQHLEGEAPKSVQSADQGSVAVQNNNGEIIIVNQPVVNVVVNGKAGRDTEHFVRHPLKRDAEKIEIAVNGKEVANASKDIADYFVPINAGEEVSEFVNDIYLKIQTVVLEGAAQWRFDDGRNKFPAKIEDKQFLLRIQEGHERFGKGDMLRVRLRSRQERAHGQLKTTHVIEKIFEHESARNIQDNLL